MASDAAVSGRMVVEFVGSACSGYKSKMRIVTEGEDGDGNAQLTDARTDTMSTTSVKRASPPPTGQRIRLAGRQFFLDRDGSGGPAVVFCPGAGLVGLDFLNVHESLARFTTSVIYDRAGTGWSDEVKLPRTAETVARELAAVLKAADVAPPYVLVGHSLGGAYIRRFAQLFPDQTAGLVFLDPAHEGYLGGPTPRLGAQLRMLFGGLTAFLNARRTYRPLFDQMFRTWPPEVRDLLIEYHLTNWRRSLAEAGNLRSAVLPEIANGGPLPPCPVIVVTAMGIDPFMRVLASDTSQREGNERKRGYYASLVEPTPGAEQRLVENAGHSTLHTDAPEAVVAAIRDVVERSKR